MANWYPQRRKSFEVPDDGKGVEMATDTKATTPAMRSEDLAKLLSRDIFDAEDAAKFLGIARNSIEYAAYRKRIPYVQYGAKKLFTRADLMDYASMRGRGRDSKLEDAPVHFVK